MMVIKGNASPKTALKFDPLRRDHLRPSRQSKERPKERPPSENKSNGFSIDKTRSEWESRNHKPVPTRPSVNKYFPHLEKSSDLYRENETPSTLKDGISWWESQNIGPQTRRGNYQRSTTAPPRLNRSFVAAIDDNIDLTAIDLVSIANEQEYQAMSNERHRCVSRTMRCHSAKTMYPDLTLPDSLEDHDSEPIIRTKPCIRATSSTSERPPNKINALSMEWCDVLGPKHCYNCDKVHKRNHYGAWNESNYETIEINTENISTLTLVERLMPDMDTRDIQHNIIEGNISRGELKREKLTDRLKHKSNIEHDKHVPRRRISAFGVPDGLGFFVNFSDLRSQLLQEEKKKKRRKGVTLTDYITIPNAEVDIEVVDNKDKHYANYFSPPLLSRSATLQPSFYAGGDSNYELPPAPTMSSLRQQASEAMVEMEASSVVKFGGIDNKDDHDNQIEKVKTAEEVTLSS